MNVYLRRMQLFVEIYKFRKYNLLCKNIQGPQWSLS